ncbi:MAG: TetR/AcrR family transcriptional regulator [Actinomycetes bacterium]
MTASAAGAAKRGPGRRPGSVDTRSEILDAARTEFAGKGYDGASVRGIARAAAVDPALIHHYFGTKEQVFAAAMALPVDPGQVLPDMLAGDPAQLGERFARTFLGLWSHEEFREPMLALLRSATTGERGAQLLREFVASAMLRRVVSAVDAPDAALRVTTAAAQLVGVVLLRYVIKVPAMVEASDEELVALVAPSLQRYFTGT